MNNAVLLQNCHSNSEYIHLIELIFSRHARYCKYWKWDYRFEYSDVISPKPEGGDWGKVKMIQRALEEYEFVVWMDSDALIWNVATDLREACVKPCNVVIYTNPFIIPAVGVMYWNSCDASKQIVAEWLTKMPGLAPWWEQGEFQNLCVEKWRARDWVGELDERWDHDDFITKSDSPVVVAFHGYSGVVVRMDAFKRWMRAWQFPSPTGVELPELVAAIKAVNNGK